MFARVAKVTALDTKVKSAIISAADSLERIATALECLTLPIVTARYGTPAEVAAVKVETDAHPIPRVGPQCAYPYCRNARAPAYLRCDDHRGLGPPRQAASAADIASELDTPPPVILECGHTTEDHSPEPKRGATTGDVCVLGWPK